MSERPTPAASILEARLEPTRSSGIVRLVQVIAAFVTSAVGGGGEVLLSGHDLVVIRRDSGREVLRIRAGQGEQADSLLLSIRRDLATQTVEEFARSWRTFDS